MQLLISDANILIDLQDGQFIEHTFRLPHQFCMPDILFFEELEEEHQRLLDLGLKLNEMEGEVIAYAMELIPRYTKASRNDCFALALAARKNYPLLTGDKALRQAAIREGVDVKGTLWVVEQLIQQNLLTVAEARTAYEQMKNAGRRLPWEEAEKALQSIENEQ